MAASASTAPTRSRAVREATDRALAVAAHGHTRWSRIILASRRRRLQAAHRVRLQAQTYPAPRHPTTSISLPSGKGPKTPTLARKAKVLGRLVPGCRNMPFPALLTEASDYIVALEMQVHAMATLAEVLSNISSASASTSGGLSSLA